MNFGKWRGHLVRDVPSSYLKWALRECSTLDAWLRQAIEAELKSRGVEAEEAPRPGRYPPPADLLRPVIKTWFAGLARDYHPDRTGDDGKVMAALNEAHERLRKLVGIA
jgi:hypothetical protein